MVSKIYVRAIHNLAADGSYGYERADNPDLIDLWGVYRNLSPWEAIERNCMPDDEAVWIVDSPEYEEAHAYAEALADWAGAQVVIEGPLSEEV